VDLEWLGTCARIAGGGESNERRRLEDVYLANRALVSRIREDAFAGVVGKDGAVCAQSAQAEALHNTVNKNRLSDHGPPMVPPIGSDSGTGWASPVIIENNRWPKKRCAVRTIGAPVVVFPTEGVKRNTGRAAAQCRIGIRGRYCGFRYLSSSRQVREKINVLVRIEIILDADAVDGDVHKGGDAAVDVAAAAGIHAQRGLQERQWAAVDDRRFESANS